MIEKSQSGNPKERLTFKELFTKFSMGSFVYFTDFDDIEIDTNVIFLDYDEEQD